MNRSIGRLLILGTLGLALSFGDFSIAHAQWSWWGGGYPGAYSYGVGYSPYWGTYSTSYWPSSYYVGYGSYSLWPSYSCGSPCCGSSCCGSSCCGSSCCPSIGCCGVSGCGGCGLSGCGISGCGGVCGSGCGLACGPDCCTGGCGTSLAGPGGCGTTAPPTPPGAKPRPMPEDGFTPRGYDPGAEPRPGDRPTRPGAGGAGTGTPPAAGTDADTGTGRYARSRSGNGTKAPPAQPPADNFDAPTQKTTPTTPASTVPKDSEQTFETKKPSVPIEQRDTDKRSPKAPIAPPDEAAPQDPKPTPKSTPDLKKPSAENKGNDQLRTKGPALTLQDRATWRLAGTSRPLFGRIANRPAPIPERLTSSGGDWAVFSADEAQVARR
jgi:hypothetical protein